MSRRNHSKWSGRVGELFADGCRALWAQWSRWLSQTGQGAVSWALPLGLAAFTLAAFWGLDAWARPGGGHTYSGGGSHGGGYHGGSHGGSGGSGGGDSGLLWLLVYLLFSHPVIGVPLLLLVVGGLVFAKWTGVGSSDEWDSAGGYEPPPPKRPKVDMSSLREHDPAFSRQVFEDFLNNLYVRAQQSRVSKDAMDRLSPYLSEPARTALSNRRQFLPLREVRGVVVGAQRVIWWSGADQDPVRVTVEFEANYTEMYEAGQPGAADSGDFYAREIWTIERKRDAKSRTPDQVASFHCPSCGAPVENSQDDACAYCGMHFGTSEFDWFVTGVAIQEERTTPPRLTGTVEEQGTMLPTVRDPNLEQGVAALKERDPEFGLESLRPRIQVIFDEMQQAWSSLEWDKARPFLTDRQFLSMSYWVDAYRKAGLRNVTTDNQITNLELVKVETDPFFDIVTVRLYAKGHDYTIDSSGNVVSGSKERERSYSEYWTLVRSVQKKDTDKDPKTCPNCGAPLSINQSGRCEYCGSKVTGGEFDWVLSRVEQDDSY